MSNRLAPYDHSNRSAILEDAIAPFMRPGMSVLDIGCGFSAYPKFQGTTLPGLLYEAVPVLAYHGIDNRPEVITQCEAAYPWGEWTAGDASMFIPEHSYDIVFHLGFDRKDLSDAWLVHQHLQDAGYKPRVVLLEAGSPTGVMSKHIESFYEVQALYATWGYILRESNTYMWSYKVTQPARRYAIMGRDE